MKVMTVKNWENWHCRGRLGVTWLRKPKPTKGCKANGGGRGGGYYMYF
jgi:hypothetical protein